MDQKTPHMKAALLETWPSSQAKKEIFKKISHSEKNYS
jgi:hypothetical protein